MCLPCEARPGCHLTTLFGYTAVMAIEVPKKKRSLLPLLTVLFLISYGLMTVLIVEQGSAIQAQRNLIKVLMRDSTELWAAKGKAIGDKQMAQAQGQNQEQAPPAQTQSSQTPSTQIPSTQVPQHHSQSQAGKIAKPQTERPPVPASDLVDQRRALHTI
jgi:outer membrane biosynthesis protein TonB